MLIKDRLIKTLTIFFLIFANALLFSQERFYNIDYYGVVSAEIDANIYKMTSDLYFTQLSEIDSLSVTDKRKEETLVKVPDISELSDNNLSFFAVIEKKLNSTTWIATLNLVDKKNNTSKTYSKEYDSYYKILMEPKLTLQESLKELITDSGSKKSSEPDIFTDSSTIAAEDSSVNSGSSTIELLAGTWTGETGISKIVIMRGGRGFVIFENGASMNILLTLSYDKGNCQLIVTQNGKPNASFFPEIPRQIALTAALNCEPIKWTFSIIDDNNLEGIKNTLILKDDKAVSGTVNVNWSKKQ